jgi:hypothetical protein
MFRNQETKAEPKPTAEERTAAKMYPTMAQEGDKAAERTEMISAQGDVEASPEATAFAAELAQQVDWIDPESAHTLEFASIATDLGIDAAGASKLAEWDQQRCEAYWDAVNSDWQTQAKQLPNFQEMLDVGNDLIRRFGSAGLRHDLVAYSFGNNPHLIAFLGAVGRAMKSNRRY